MARPTVEDRIEAAQTAFEAGFLSKAAQKRALDDLNRAYSDIQRNVHDAVITHANETPELWDNTFPARWDFFRENDLPFDLHQVRDRHFPIIEKWSDRAPVVRDLIALRAAIKEAEIATKPVNEEKEKVETVRKAIIDELEMRKAQYVEGLEIARLFNGLPVSVNAHWVYGHKGARFIRHFFYLRGKLTPLNMIIAIAQGYEREQQAKEMGA